jgi:cardiolipin synthase
MRKRTRWLIAVGTVVFHVLGFFSSIHAVMSTRTSQGAIAWAVTLNTIPWAAVPAYWVFGRSKFRGYVTARHEGDAEIQHVVREAATAVTPFISTLGEEYGSVRAAELLAKIPVLTDNSVELLVDGDATFASIFEGIEQAEEYILVQFYIVKDDELGRELQQRLIARAREGIRVYFLYDEVGSHRLPRRYRRELEDAGGQIRDFHSRKGPWNRFQLNFRNHRKIVVVDGRAAWVGGHNVGVEYLGQDPDFGPWRDTHIKLVGPAVQPVQLSFFEDWHWATDQMPQLDATPTPAEGGTAHVLVMPTGPADTLETAGLMFTHAIHSAVERIWIASPYFVPDEAVMAALLLAGLRGVDVRILIPDNPDHLLVYLAAFTYFQEASHTGVQIYRYEEGFMHQKAMLVDGATAAIGTANLDNRSFRLNFEITTWVVDSAFAGEVEKMFLADFARSHAMVPSDYNDRSFWFKLGARLSRLAAPIL